MHQIYQAKGGISEYVAGREGILEVFLILGYCRVVLFDCFFFLEVFYTSYSSEGCSQRGLWVRAGLWKLFQGGTVSWLYTVILKSCLRGTQKNRIHLWLCPECKQDEVKDTQAPLSCPRAVFVWLDRFQLAEWGQVLSKSCNRSG